MFTKNAWPIRLIVQLAAAAVVLVIISLLLFVHFSGAAPESTYVPAHVEDGRLVPGTFK